MSRFNNLAVVVLSLPLIFLFSCSADQHASSTDQPTELNHKLRSFLQEQNVSAMDPGPNFTDEKIKLGKKLFWDKILSGNKDISCAGCHHPAQGTSDALPISIGTKSRGDHFNRRPRQNGEFVPRNAQDLWNRGSPRWRTLFHDMRVRKIKNSGILLTPAGFELPESIENLQAAQAMIPVTARTEMRGERGDQRIDGEANKIANIPEGQFEDIWDAYTDRLKSNSQYQELLKEAYPEKQLDELSFAHAANAIAAYQIEAFTFLNSPWDRYLKGNNDALSRKQKHGALIFYGKGRCSNCHAGPLMTDQQAHNIGVPQLGPGKEPDEPYDLGFFNETGKPKHRFAFRTPPLRNVTVSGPWMHNGAYSTLEGAVRHHLNPQQSLNNYSSSQLSADLRRVNNPPILSSALTGIPKAHWRKDLIKSVRLSEKDKQLVQKTLDPFLEEGIDLNNNEVTQLLSFLRSLTSPTVKKENGELTETLRETIPDTVPSNLPIAGVK